MLHMFSMTSDELAELNQELLALLLPRYRERLTDPAKRPPDAAPVELLAFPYPMKLPTAHTVDPEPEEAP
jgi:hypothetical protein